MLSINDLPKHPKNIDTNVWRGFCLGWKEDGTPAGSDSTWAKYRSTLNIKDRHNISAYHSYLLLVRSRLTLICGELGIKRPKSDDLDLIELIRIANLWISTSGEGWRENIIRLASDKGLPTSAVHQLVEEWLGKPISERTLRRKYKKAGITLKRGEALRPLKLKRLYRVVKEK
jgi:hypothetical protein